MIEREKLYKKTDDVKVDDVKSHLLHSNGVNQDVGKSCLEVKAPLMSSSCRRSAALRAD
ncbi:MAG: hypothetical protein ACTSXC_03095 [Candidatus Freyarchaeota archaeon]